MHLFALLFAAAFASNFVAPNPIGGIASTTPTTLKALDFLLGVPAFAATADDDPTAAKIARWTLGKTETAGQDDLELDWTGGLAEKTYTFLPNIDLTPLLGDDDAVPTSVWLHLEEIDDPDVSKRSSNSEPDKEITVTAAPTFTVNDGEPVEIVDPTKMPALTIEPANDERWAAMRKVCFTVGEEEKCTTLNIEGSGEKTYTTDEEDITVLALDIDDLPETITVTLKLESAISGEATEYIYPQTATLAPVKKEADFTVDPDTLTPDDLNATSKVVITGPAGEDAWAEEATVLVKFSKDRLDLTGSITGTETAEFNDDTDKWDVTANLVALKDDLPEDATRIFVYVKVDTDWLPVPFELKYDQIADPVGTFTIQPKTWAYEVLAAQTVPLVFTDTSDPQPTPTQWEDEMIAKFVVDGVDPITAPVGKEGSGETATWQIETVDLTDLAIPETGGTIKVFLSPAATPKYLPLHETITVSAKVPPALAFTFTPTTITEEDLETELEITAAPIEDGAWDEAESVKVIFTLTNAKPDAEVPNLTFTLDPPETPESNDDPAPWTGIATLSALVVPEGQLNLWVWVKVDATILLVGKELTYEPGTPEEEVEFTVSPTTVDLRTTTKATITVEQKEQTEPWEEHVWLYFSRTETAPTANTLKKEAKLVEADDKDQWAVEEFTFTDITGIAKDDTIYVYVRHGADDKAADGVLLPLPATFAVTQSEEPKVEAAMGVSPLVSLLAALVFLFVKLF